MSTLPKTKTLDKGSRAPFRITGLTLFIPMVIAPLVVAYSLLDHLERDEEPGVVAVSNLVIPPGREIMARQLVQDVGFMETSPEGWTVDQITIDHDEVVYQLTETVVPGEPPQRCQLVLKPKGRASIGEVTTTSFSAVWIPEAPGAIPPEALRLRLEQSVRAHDAGGFYVQASDHGDTTMKPVAEAQLAQSWTMREQAAAILQVLAVVSLLLLLFHALTGRSWQVIFAFKLTHLLPAILQSTIYLYWWMYWSGVGEYLPLLAMHLAFAYLFEAFFSLLVHRTWKVGFGPLPVVGSTGLFIWFVGADVWLGFLAIAIAIGSKNLLRPGGSHVFNPSALGVSVVGVLALIWPQQVGYTDIASELNLAPNMTELILLLALVVQFKLKTVTLTLSAFGTLWALHWFNLVDVLLPTWPAVFLVMTLLATDPFTSPRRPLGRIIFGVLLGIGLGVSGEVLVGYGQSDFFAKVFPVVLLNPLSGPLDRLAAKAPAWIDSLAKTRINAPLVASWVAIVVVALASGAKEGAFETALHAEYDTPHIRAAASAPPSCTANQVFCEPFSVMDEISLWVEEPGPPAPQSPSQ